MQQRPPSPVALTFICLVLLFWNTTGNADIKDTHMTASELQQLVHAGNAPAVIDVRSSREYNRGHVPGAIHMPFWKSFSRAAGLTAPRDRTVVVYCAHGPRAGIGRFALRRAGFTDVRYLEGHMSGWHRSGLPVETGAGQ